MSACRWCGADLSGARHRMTFEEELRLADEARAQQEPYVEQPLSSYGVED